MKSKTKDKILTGAQILQKLWQSQLGSVRCCDITDDRRQQGYLLGSAFTVAKKLKVPDEEKFQVLQVGCDITFGSLEDGTKLYEAIMANLADPGSEFTEGLGAGGRDMERGFDKFGQLARQAAIPNPEHNQKKWWQFWARSAPQNQPSDVGGKKITGLFDVAKLTELAQGRKCLMCGGEMRKEQFSLTCSQGHDRLDYFAFDNSYCTFSKSVADSFSEGGCKVQKVAGKEQWNIFA
jgi:hypothetical protein